MGYLIFDAQCNDILMNIRAETQIFQGSDFGPNDEVYCEAALHFYFNSSLNQVYLRYNQSRL